MLLRRLRYWMENSKRNEMLREEMELHLQEKAVELEEEGMAPKAAMTEARRRFGNVVLKHEESREIWILRYWSELVQDVRYGFRTMTANKTFSLLAILSLALGIGANTAIYSFMDTLLLRSLPVPDPETLAVLNWREKPGGRDSVMHSMSGSTWTEAELGRVSGIFPYPAFELIQKNSGTVFSSVFAYYPTRKVNVMVQGQAEQAGGEFVSGEYFAGLAVPPAAGRMIIPGDDRAGAEAVAVLSFPFAQRRFGDVGSAPGKSILINNVPFTVAGVAPSGFYGVDPSAAPDFYIPLRSGLALQLRHGGNESDIFLAQNYYWLEMMARLRPGVSLAEAQAALGPLFHQWVDSTAANEGERVQLPELLVREGATGLNTLRRRYSKPLYVLLGMVALILAIACANIANLLLARATARTSEMAVRLSIGAGRLRLIRQLLTESVLLASIGGAVGVVFAFWGIRFLTLLLAAGNPDFTLYPDLNWHVLGAAVALSVATGLLFGLAPALQSTRLDLMPALKNTQTGRLGLHRFFPRASLSQILVSTQIGISLLLLVAAGLFVRTLSNLQSIQLGFNRENVLLFRVNARQAGHQDPEIKAFYLDLQKRLRAIPGVLGASASDTPLLGEGTSAGPLLPAGAQPIPGKNPHILRTGPEFFSTMQIPVLLGRAINERDRPGSLAVALVSEAYVKTYFKGQNPLGQHLSNRHPSNVNGEEVEIVGVAGNARYGELKGEFREVVYLSANQLLDRPVDEMTFALRTSGDPLRYVESVRKIVREADARIPVTNIRTQAEQIDHMMNQEIILARLCSAFALLALLIACVGLYGTMAYAVARRTSEIGIRIALGAQGRNVIWMMLRQAFLLAIAGLAIGIPTAIGTSRFVESFLFGVEPANPAALAGAVGILLSAVLLSGYVPARRASRIDPMIAVRHE